MIDVVKLIACGVHPTQAKVFAPHLAKACEHFGIHTVGQQAAFVAQAMHESARFTKMEEDMFYRTPERIHAVFYRLRNVPLSTLANYIKKPQALANLAYAGVNGNGDEASGDGWRYRARGPFGLTGRANYMAAGSAAGVDYKSSPELVAEPMHGSMTAGWFWATARLNTIYDRGGIDPVSKRVNGGSNGLAERRELFATCIKALL